MILVEALSVSASVIDAPLAVASSQEGNGTKTMDWGQKQSTILATLKGEHLPTAAFDHAAIKGAQSFVSACPCLSACHAPPGASCSEELRTMSQVTADIKKYKRDHISQRRKAKAPQQVFTDRASKERRDIRNMIGPEWMLVAYGKVSIPCDLVTSYFIDLAEAIEMHAFNPEQISKCPVLFDALALGIMLMHDAFTMWGDRRHKDDVHVFSGGFMDSFLPLHILYYVKRDIPKKRYTITLVFAVPLDKATFNEIVEELMQHEEITQELTQVLNSKSWHTFGLSTPDDPNIKIWFSLYASADTVNHVLPKELREALFHCFGATLNEHKI